MAWPPYRLMERDYLAEAKAKYDRVERLYHVGAKQAWDGKQVLKDLLKKHGGIHLDPTKKNAIAQIFSTILWGELAAWSISADLGAAARGQPRRRWRRPARCSTRRATSTCMRDYLLALGLRVAKLGGCTRARAGRHCSTPHRLVDKLLGMQLMVEIIARDPVQAVARGAGRAGAGGSRCPTSRATRRATSGSACCTCPSCSPGSPPFEAARLKLLQLEIVTLIGWGTHLKMPTSCSSASTTTKPSVGECGSTAR